MILLACKGRSIPQRAIDWVCIAASAVALFVLCQEQAIVSASSLIVFSVAAAGVFMAWFIVRWAPYYAALGAKEMLIRVLVAIILISLLKLISFTMPLILVPYLYGILLVAMVLVLHAKSPVSDSTATGEGGYTIKTILSLWQTILSIVLFFILWSFLNMAFNINVGHLSTGGSMAGLLIASSQIIDIGFSLFMLWWILKLKRAIDWTLFWQIAYFFLALGLLTMSVFGTTRVVQVFLSAAAELVFMFLVYFLTRLGRRTVYAPSLVVALGYALISLCDWAVRAIVSYDRIGIEEGPFVPVFLFVILFTIVFFLPARSPGMQLLTSELQDLERVNKFDGDRCRNLAVSHGLSSRELEVLVLLCRGRSAPYIAETLYLSENTVKTYRKRIYQKLGVHDKQELLDRVEEDGGAG